MKIREKLKTGLIVLTLTLGGLTACSGEATAEATQAEALKAEAAPSVPAGEPRTDGATVAFDAPPPAGTKATCPVMGGEFTVTENTERSEYKGKHFTFCCPGCKPSFDADPEKYLKN